jgi:preprotein translocase subunit SecF/SecD/SecF fusion protein
VRRPTVLIRVEQQPGGEGAQQAGLQKVIEALGSQYVQRRVEVVGPAVSSELRMTGFIAVAAGLLAIVAYVWFRFEWQFAVGAIVALTHDVLLTVGIFSLLQMEFDLSIVAALLTILGYSVNDTVVVSDRIRENLRKFKRMDLNELLNLSRSTRRLSRTILTAVRRTWVAGRAVTCSGRRVIRNFNFASCSARWSAPTRRSSSAAAIGARLSRRQSASGPWPCRLGPPRLRGRQGPQGASNVALKEQRIGSLSRACA